jgi:hypothetical protein
MATESSTGNITMRIIYAIFLSLAFIATAGAADRSAKIQSLMKAQGLLESFEKMQKSAIDGADKQAHQMVAQMLDQLNPPEDFRKQFDSAAADFLADLRTPWPAKDLVDEWSKVYGAEFSDNELDRLLAYYSSPLGQKEIAVMRAALPKFMAHIQELQQPLLQKAVNNYLQRLQSIARDCNCKRT